MIAVPLAAAAPVVATPAEAPSAPAAAKASDTEPTAIESAHLDATDAAKESGKATPVDGLTTGQSQVLAQPDGSFTMTSSPETVRVEEGGKWQPVDTRLVRNSDGTLSPARAAIDLTFSGGGKAPMLEIANGNDKSIGFTWPKALPEPTLDGNVATYAEVLAGVDLKLVAYADSFGEVLVVKNAEAATNPALRRLTLGTVSRGLELTKNAQGGLAAVDANGEAVFSGPAPYMWDSANKPGSPASSAEDSDGGKVTEVGLSVEKATDKVTLMPPVTALAGPGVDYPVYIDPSMKGQSDDTRAGSHELTVHEAGWDYFNDPVQPLRVGYCGWYGGDSNCNDAQQLKSRSYFSFHINDLQLHDDVAIFSAKVTAKQLHVANCNSPQPTELWTADNFSQSADQHWPGPRGTKLQTNSGGCSGTFLTYGGWSAGDPVKEYVKSSVAAGQTAIQFNVSAANESDRNQWKKLDSPELEVMYNFRPGDPQGLKVNGARECPGQQRYFYDKTPTLQAWAYNYGKRVGIDFEVLRASDNAVLRYTKNGPQPTDSEAVIGWTTNGENTNSSSDLPDGTYRMRARSTTFENDGTNLKSAYTTSPTYILDTVNPATPVVSSFDYPRDYWGSMSGEPGYMNVKGSADTRAFIYSIDTSGGQSIPDVTDCSLDDYKDTQRGLKNANADGDASFQLAENLSPGPHTLYVKAIDNAGRISPQSTGYTFFVSRQTSGAGNVRVTATPQDAPGPVIVNGSIPEVAGGDFHQIVATQGTNDQPSTFELKFQTYLDAADYALGIGLVETSHHGKIRFRLDGKEVRINDTRVTVDTQNATARSTFVQLGGAHLTKGIHTLKVEIYGTTGQNFRYNGTYSGISGPVTLNNVDDNGYSVGVDYLIRVPINNVTYASFASALNNDAIAPLGTPANIGPSSGYSGIPLEAMTAKQMAPGSTKVIDGVSFVMPAQDADGDDNVVAMGQTIKLDAPVVAKKVHLLVNSSCGETPVSTRVAVDVNHVHPQPTPEEPVLVRYFQIPRVPTWLNGTADGVSPSNVTLAFGTDVDYASVGGTKVTTGRPTFYHMEIPVAEADQTRAIESVTLPNLGTALDNDCNTSALHVYSIATTN